MTLSFQVPLPPRELSSNGSHGHWSKVSKARKEYRETVGWIAVKENVKAHPTNCIHGHPKVRMSVTFCIKGGRGQGYQPRDAANGLAAFKSGIDGICDALAIDDSAKHLDLGAILIDSTRGPFVEVEVTPL